MTDDAQTTEKVYKDFVIFEGDPENHNVGMFRVVRIEPDDSHDGGFAFEMIAKDSMGQPRLVSGMIGHVDSMMLTGWMANELIKYSTALDVDNFLSQFIEDPGKHSCTPTTVGGHVCSVCGRIIPE